MSAGASVEEAARNNAEWCDSFFRTHGINGRFDFDAWTSATRTPPLYPDAVTLVAGASVEAILLRVDTSVGCAIKDSFADLSLAPLGLIVCLPPSGYVRSRHAGRLRRTTGR